MTEPPNAARESVAARLRQLWAMRAEISRWTTPDRDASLDALDAEIVFTIDDWADAR